jgi:hypothetical protein
MGIGFKYTIDRRWGISLEYGFRYTFTDYIDDVSKTYYDRDALAEYRGDLAAALSDKSKATTPTIRQQAMPANNVATPITAIHICLPPLA